MTVEKIDVMVVGSGGREHGFAWKIRQSPLCGRLLAVPGNPGIWALADAVFNLPVPKSPFAAQAEKDRFLTELLSLCQREKPGLIVIQTEDAFFAVDALRAAGFLVFGPSMAAAEIETSKIKWQAITRKTRTPKPKGWVCRTPEEARRVVARHGLPLVIKADGPARGKGVFPVFTQEEALERIQALMVNLELGESGRHVLIQEFIQEEGGGKARELSLHFITDGETILDCPTSCDHKEHQGKNTGGMAAYSPAYWLAREDKGRLRFTFGEKPIKGMAALGLPFQGIFYPGIILTQQSMKMLEVNARAGDPEWLALVIRLVSDLLPILIAVAKADGSLARMSLSWDLRPSFCLVLCSKGYPNEYEVRKYIYGLKKLQSPFEFQLFHAGTTLDKRGRLVTDGGRVLYVTVKAKTLLQARKEAYRLAHRINFQGKDYARGVLKELDHLPQDVPV